MLNTLTEVEIEHVRFPALRLAKSSRFARRVARVLLVLLAGAIVALGVAPLRLGQRGASRLFEVILPGVRRPAHWLALVESCRVPLHIDDRAPAVPFSERDAVEDPEEVRKEPPPGWWAPDDER